MTASGVLVSSRIARALRVQPGEGRRVAWMMLYSAAIMGGMVVVGSAAASALFLSTLPDSATPYLFIASGVVSVLFFLGYSLAAARVPLGPLVLGSDLLLIGITLALRLLLATPLGNSFAVLLALDLFVEVSIALLIAQFWVIAAQIFNAREGQRLFGLMAAGGTLASMVFGLALQTGLGEAVGVPNLLFVVALSLVVCILCVRVLLAEREHDRGGPERMQEIDPEAQEPAIAWRTLLADLAEIGRSPLLRVIAGLTVLSSLAINTGAYQFFLSLQSLFAGQSDSLVAFLGGFNLWTGAAALFVQVCLAERLMRRTGVFGALLLLPLALGLGEALGLLTGGALLAMTLVRATSPVISETVNAPAMTVLYLPVPADLRQRAKNILEMAYGLVFGLMGVVFLLSQQVPGWTYVSWAVPVLLFVALWLVLIRWGKPKYQQALATDLRSRRLDFTSLTIDVRDKNTVEVLAAALRSPDDLLVIHTLELIGQAPAVDWSPFVIPLLEHRSPEVRRLALGCLAARGCADEAPAIEPHLLDPDEEVQAAAVGALAACGGAAAASRLAAQLQGAGPSVRGAITVALHKYGGPAWAKTAATVLDGLLAGPDAASLCAGAQAAGALGDPRLAARLAPLLRADDAVANAALRASAALLNPAVRDAGPSSAELLPGLLACLDRPGTAAAAADALAAYGPGIEPALDVLLDRGPDKKHDRASAWAAGILQRLGTAAAVATLGRHLGDEDETVRAAIYKAFAGLAGHEEPLLTVALRERLLAEIAIYYRLYVQQASLRPNDASAAAPRNSWRGKEQVLRDVAEDLLFQALASRQAGALGRIACLLEALYPATIAGNARQAIHSEEPETRATVVELLATAMAEPAKSLVIPMLEGPGERILDVASRRLGLARRPAREVLEELAAGSDRWLRGSALAALGRSPQDDEPAMTTTFERVGWLQRSELFCGLGGEDLAPVAERAQEVCFAAGETFIREGERGDGLYIPVTGEVSIRRRGLGEVAVSGPGSVIGEMAVTWRAPRSADCVARGDVKALHISGSDFWALMSQQPRLAHGVIDVLVQRLDDTTARVERDAAGQVRVPFEEAA
jgi:CRP-like cAMP-binding protein